MLQCIECKQVNIVPNPITCSNYCDDCIKKAKNGSCSRCKFAFCYFPSSEHYLSVDDNFLVEFCNFCLANTPCVMCDKIKEGESLICDHCGLDGYTCKSCIGLDNIPEGIWHCIPCRRQRKKDTYCSFTHSSVKKVIQYAVTCETCKQDLCLACVGNCHDGHKVTRRLQHGKFACQCLCLIGDEAKAPKKRDRSPEFITEETYKKAKNYDELILICKERMALIIRKDLLLKELKYSTNREVELKELLSVLADIIKTITVSSSVETFKNLSSTKSSIVEIEAQIEENKKKTLELKNVQEKLYNLNISLQKFVSEAE